MWWFHNETMHVFFQIIALRLVCRCDRLYEAVGGHKAMDVLRRKLSRIVLMEPSGWAVVEAGNLPDFQKYEDL